MIWFTSDLHLGHRSAISMNGRPFEDVEEMNEALIRRYNEVVAADDTVYILGDLCYRMPIEEADQLIGRLNGKKTLLKGNHDKNYDESLFEGIYDFLEIHVDGLNISLMHYPMLEWPKSHYGAVHLHGHSHNAPEYNQEQRTQNILRYDVGVDANHYSPVSLQMIRDFFSL